MYDNDGTRMINAMIDAVLRGRDCVTTGTRRLVSYDCAARYVPLMGRD